MDKKKLIEYLDAVCDAESAVQACNDAISAYETLKGRMPTPQVPIAPVHEVATKKPGKASDYWGYIGWILWLPLWCIYCLIFDALGLTLDVGGSTPHGLALAIISSVLISRLLQKHMNERKTESDYEREKQRIALNNHQADRQYNERLTSYNESKSCYDKAISIYDMHIRNQESLRQTAQKHLDTLYSYGIIYQTFHNLIAAYQIREYLQMGICEELEGPNGAYAMYMNDVRTARVCDSISDLKKSLTSAIRSLQGTLVQELRIVNSNLAEMQGSLSNSMQGISQQMQEMQRIQQAGTSQLGTHLAQANQHLASLRSNTAIMAHNQYVEQRLRNVDAYLLRWPNG